MAGPWIGLINLFIFHIVHVGDLIKVKLTTKFWFWFSLPFRFFTSLSAKTFSAIDSNIFFWLVMANVYFSNTNILIMVFFFFFWKYMRCCFLNKGKEKKQGDKEIYLICQLGCKNCIKWSVKSGIFNLMLFVILNKLSNGRFISWNLN